MTRGIFIVVEGLSGSGKNTQLYRIAEDLYERLENGLDLENVLMTREPSKTAAGRRALEQKDKDKKAGVSSKANARLYAQLFNDDTIEHGEKLILPNLLQGTHVVCGRYYHSRLVYQEYQGVPLDELLRQKEHPSVIVPDLTIVLDVPPEVALGRVKKGVAGQQAGRSGQSLMERLEVMRELYTRYRALPQILPKERIVSVNGDQTPDAVFAEIKPHLDSVWAEYEKRK